MVKKLRLILLCPKTESLFKNDLTFWWKYDKHSPGIQSWENYVILNIPTVLKVFFPFR